MENCCMGGVGEATNSAASLSVSLRALWTFMCISEVSTRTALIDALAARPRCNDWILTAEAIFRTHMAFEAARA